MRRQRLLSRPRPTHRAVWYSVLGPCLLSFVAGTAADLPARAASPDSYAIVVTGGELLNGTIADSHTGFLARTLLPLGLHCVQSQLVDDSPEDLRMALGVAANRASLVLVTGGLGPTVNDITREVVSDFTGIPLREDPRLVQELAARFGQLPEQLRANLRRQTQVPVRGGYLPNRSGTAVGLIYEAEGTTVIALPGPPRELRPMVEESLVPWLRDRLGLADRGCSLTLRFVGLGQSAIDTALREESLLPEGAVIGSQFESSRVDFTFSYPAETVAAHVALARLTEGILASSLADRLYATNATSLEQVVLDHLEERGLTLALAETGGPHLAASFSRAVPGSQVLRASYASPDPDSLRRLLKVPDAIWAMAASPRERAIILAEATRDAADVSGAVAVSERKPTAAGRVTVWAAFASQGSPTLVWEITTWPSPETGWTNLVNELLDRLRHWRPDGSVQGDR